MYRLTSAIVFTLLLQSCASADLNRRLDERLAQESGVQSRRDLDAKATDLLKNTPGLSGKQRQDLAALKADVRAKLGANSRESLRLRAILVDDVLAPGDHAQETLAVKDRLRTLAKERINTIFDAVTRANDLLGRSTLIREAMDLQMLQDQND